MTPLELIKNTVKAAVQYARASRWDDFYTTYAQLFGSPDFAAAAADDQRQALRLMISTKGLPPPTSQAGIQAYQAAWYVIHGLINKQPTPGDYELFGLTYLRLGAEQDAQKIFQTGLELAQQAKDSDLCGAFLRHLSTL